MAAFLRLAFLAPGLAFAFASAPAEVVPELRAEAAALIRRFQEAKALEDPLYRQLQELANGSAEGEHAGITEEKEIDAEEEEEEFTPVDVGCSWTLMGSLFFTMVMFYFVNYPDFDIKRYTWSIITTTISVFTAVLTFQAVDAVVLRFIVTPILHKFPVEVQDYAKPAVGFLIFLIWYAVALFAIAMAASLFKTSDPSWKGHDWVILDALRGDHGEAVERQQLLQGCRSKGIAEVEGVEVFVSSRPTVKEKFERRTKCWAMLYAHMSAFAMISAGGDLQNAKPFVTNPAFSWLAIGLCVLFLLLVFSITAIKYTQLEETEAGRLFVEESREAEDDVFCVAISFLVVQSARFTITGVLPSKLGLYHELALESHQSLALYGVGVLLAVLMTICALTLPRSRGKDLVVGCCSMGFAWAFLFATRCLFDSWPLLQKHNISPVTIEGRVLLAMTLSLFTCGFIIVLDKVEDALREDGEDKLYKLVKNIITALSILVGFTWEHTFDGCVEAISSLWEDALGVKLILTFLITLVVIPAWRKYILAKVVEIEKLDRERKEAARHESSRFSQETSSEEEATARLLC